MSCVKEILLDFIIMAKKGFKIFETFFRKLFFRKKPRKQLSQIDIDNFCKKIGYRFRKPKLLHQALKHRSFLTETREPRIESNERLEFLGDSVLGMVVTDHLFHMFPAEEEGNLTSKKSLVVSRRVITQVGLDLEIGEYLLLNDSEIRSGGRTRPSIISDAFEAIIGAIYLDGGLEPARQFINDHLLCRLDKIIKSEANQNYKSMLLEYCQADLLGMPVYYVVDEEGPDHEKVFTIEVKVDGKVLGQGKGRSKKKAEQIAAKKALASLKAD